MPYVCIVDDEADIREILEIHLAKTNLELKSFEDGQSFLNSLTEKVPDAVILDIMMENKNGYEVLNEIRKKYPEMGVIFLSAKSQTWDKVLGLDMGADDYLTKPFAKDELIARLKAILRRKALTQKSNKKTGSWVYQYKTLIFNVAEKTLHIGEKNVEITRTEYLLLKLLTSSPKKIFSRDEILDSVWKDSIVNERTIDVHVRRLRNKMGSYEALLKTHSGFGYSISEI